MRIVFFSLVFPFFGLVSFCSTTPNQNSNSSDFTIESVTTREVNQVLALAKMPRLEDVPLARNDVEIRVWRGFGIAPLEGVIFSRRNGVYAATHLKADQYYAPTIVSVSILDPPRTGWEKFWGNVLEESIGPLLLSTADCYDSGHTDGLGYVLEKKESGDNYSMKFVDQSRCHEIARIDDIAIAIAVEFGPGSEQCRGSTWLPCLYERGKVPPNQIERNSKMAPKP